MVYNESTAGQVALDAIGDGKLRCIGLGLAGWRVKVRRLVISHEIATVRNGGGTVVPRKFGNQQIGRPHICAHGGLKASLFLSCGRYLGC